MHAHMQFCHEHLPAILAVWGDGTPQTVELTKHQPEEDFRNGSPEKVEQDIMLLERLIRDCVTPP